MKKILRSAVLIGGIATSLALTATSANAAGGGHFTGTARVTDFGTGATSGDADLCVTGTINGTTAVCTSGSNVHATYTVFEDPATCPATGTASGSFTGAVSGSFDWTRVGANAVISIPPGGTFTAGGTGTAAFAVTSPIGGVCGADVTATVSGVIHAN